MLPEMSNVTVESFHKGTTLLETYPGRSYIVPNIKKKLLLWVNFVFHGVNITNDLDWWQNHSLCIVHQGFPSSLSLVVESLPILHAIKRNVELEYLLTIVLREDDYNRRVGNPFTLNSEATLGNRVQSTWATLTTGGYNDWETWFQIGSNFLQWPHQGA